MHHVRGLVRRAGRHTLRGIEVQAASAQSPAACVRRVRLLDVDGHTHELPLLHFGALLKLTEKMSREEALAALREVNLLLNAEDTTATSATASSSSSQRESPATATTNGSDAPPSVLYVKDDCVEADSEVQRRQRRFVAKLHGRYVSSEPQAVEATLEKLLATPLPAQDDAAVAEYRGMVESLASTDISAAIALAINPALPHLTSAASAALASLVQVHSPAAVHAFLESFANKDELTLASETCATHLALRLRHALTPGDTEKQASTSPSGAAATGRLLKEATHFNVDPGVVFPAEPTAVQSWAEQFLTSAMLPAEKAAVLLREVRQRRLQPRLVSMDALSIWTLNDLKRPWLRAALESRLKHNDSSSADGGNAGADEIWRSTAYQLALKDPKRNLVDNRLLHTYAAALARDDISALDDSFSSFLEECGECHSAGDAERPSTLSFTLPRLPSDVPLLRALQDLAPQCSYWRTLLTHHAAASVQAYTAPMHEVKVQVQLPSTHECVVAAQSGRVPLPSVPVLYEDAEVLVVDKPAGLATSRHGLSSTQVGQPTTDLISVLLATKFQDAAGMQRVFRQGQVHRLDAETSGCLLIAKTDVAADSLRHQMGTSAAFSHQSKIYHAMCLVLEPSLRNVKLKDEVVDVADPKIRTAYRVLRFFPKHRIAWLECRIQQGKKHQIRRHLASRGLPILADVEHAGAACCQSMMDRVALHARSVSFIHPVTAHPLVVVAPLPADFQRCLAQLR
ncbi:putative mitochondrial hypothetical protein [Leptomonas pyrrhocoris]|uniref:Pseudouridine synthase RsuA/RluA-like domain-containing protein n=1 Tax=Leptomonas pyrrhocoris TaxID=157538 RepID=A0A0M9GB36_LEPPY|nr:putative mitochondrial hypothetical protein [Leptomonas pyrrhocoris]KPA86647.1 putative mitochondrial hypothetical protein [Leptomonas pyrrhocoris]|eukprot:XP_015665086.1 putative mitochondrial hypothetical protein [Leptomonas pyrrhocoris]